MKTRSTDFPLLSFNLPVIRVKFILHILILLSCILTANISCGQGLGINMIGALPDSTAALDVNFTNKGFLTPRMTNAQRNAIAGPATGLVVYQTNGVAGFWYNAGTPASPNWVQLVPNPSNSSLDMTSNSITNLPAPIAGSDAATKSYVDNAVGAAGGPSWTNFQVFNAGGTFTVPAGVSLIKVQVYGGGGGGGSGYSNTSAYQGSYTGAGGGGGGFAEGIYIVAPGTPYVVTIGSGGAGGVSFAYGSDGTSSSFGALISATGGKGGTAQNGAGGQGGMGTGGYLNTTLGSGGESAWYNLYNGSSIKAGQGAGEGGTGSGITGGGGGGGKGGGNGGGQNTAGQNADPNSGAGGGGGGNGYSESPTNYSGGNGADGKVVVFW